MCKIVEDYAREREIISEARGIALGEARGEARGIALGEARGKALGEIIAKVETIDNMLEDKVPLETALKYAKLDKETYEKYSKHLQ